MPFSRRHLPNSTEARLAASLFLVEANSFEYHALWADHSHESLWPPYDQRLVKRAYDPVHWEQVCDGKMEMVGKLGNREVWVSFRWAWLDGQLIAFWEATSQLVDHKLVDAWLAKHFTGRYDNGHRPATCDAMNFGHCLSAIDEANAAAAKLQEKVAS